MSEMSCMNCGRNPAEPILQLEQQGVIPILCDNCAKECARTAQEEEHREWIEAEGYPQ